MENHHLTSSGKSGLTKVLNISDDSHVPQRTSQSPISENRLPPGYQTGKMNKIVAEQDMSSDTGKHRRRRTIGRRVSHNVLPDVSKEKNLDSVSGIAAKLPKESTKRIDYVIVYETGKKSKRNIQRILKLQEQFMKSLAYDDIEVHKEEIGDNVFMKLHVPFSRLCHQAEKIKLEMPLKGCSIYKDDKECCNWWYSFEEKYLVTDDEVDFVTAPYQMNKHHLFENHDKPEIFFRPAVRCFLAHNILINSDLRKVETGEEQDSPLAKRGLPSLLHEGVYKDAFILHDESKTDPFEKLRKDEIRAAHGVDVDIEDPDCLDEESELLMADTRQELMDTWAKFCPQKYQPLWKIRNYFGEKIALYFAWVGVWIETLWIPTIFGSAVFIYGLYLSSTAKAESITQEVNNSSSVVSRVTTLVQESLGVIKESFDNDVTPFYALGICLWGTIFLEVWKRRNAELAYEWDVESFEDNEPDRPQFIGTAKKPDPIIIGEETWYYPMKWQCMKFVTSFVFLIFMVIVVFIAAGSVILYRVFMTFQYCENMSSVNCLLVTTVASSVLNAVAIMILGKLYDLIAIKLTDWENHRTQTRYDDALIIKLFAFQFANSYTSCFYIAFFRGLNLENGLFGLGEQYQDTCGEGSCMAMLSFQVLILMLIKPLPKLLKDIILPWLKKLWRKTKCCRKQNQITDGKVHFPGYLERELLKPDVGDFTLGEYTEKCIIYGFLMLFAASFPLAPLIALLVALIDIRVDARRLLWMYRRPVSVIAQDIGMWYAILQFLNFVGVVTNGFIIAFTSTWGSKYSLTGKLWIVIIFEHIVLFIKLLLAAVIPDVPSGILLATKREKYQVSLIMGTASETAEDQNIHKGKHSMKYETKAQNYHESDEVGSVPPESKEKKKRRKKRAVEQDTVEEEMPYSGEDYGRNSQNKSSHVDESFDSDIPYPRPQLSYDPDGTTHIGMPEKFPKQKKTPSKDAYDEELIPIPEVMHPPSRNGRRNKHYPDGEESTA